MSFIGQKINRDGTTKNAVSQPKQIRLNQSDHLLRLIDSIVGIAISIDVSFNKTQSV